MNKIANIIIEPIWYPISALGKAIKKYTLRILDISKTVWKEIKKEVKEAARDENNKEFWSFFLMICFMISLAVGVIAIAIKSIILPIIASPMMLAFYIGTYHYRKALKNSKND